MYGKRHGLTAGENDNVKHSNYYCVDWLTNLQYDGHVFSTQSSTVAILRVHNLIGRDSVVGLAFIATDHPYKHIGDTVLRL